MESIVPSATGSRVDESTWLTLLQIHIQEWKQHYNHVSQAIYDLEIEHQHVRSIAGQLNYDDETAMIAEQDRQVDELIIASQLKREFIRERQQRELAKL